MPARSLQVAVAAVIVVSLLGLSAHRSVGSESPLVPMPEPSIGTLPTTATTVAPVTQPDPEEAVRLYSSCIDDTHTAPSGVAVGQGTGPVVGVIGDSLTTQIRPRILADPAHRWVVWSRCGASTQTALDAGAVAAVRAERPDVVVVALGTNDAGFPTPAPGTSAGFGARAQRVLTALSGVPCVVWINVAQHGDPVLRAEMDTINASVRASGVRVVGWDRVVESEPGLLLDHVHLTPAGQVRRTQAVTAAVDEC